MGWQQGRRETDTGGTIMSREEEQHKGHSLNTHFSQLGFCSVTLFH